MKTAYVASVLFCFSSLALAQGEQFRALADDWFQKDHFAVASPYYIALVKADPNNPTLNYRLGICYLHSRSQKAKAVNCFEKATIATTALSSENGKKETPSSRADPAQLAAYKLLADAYHHTYRFDEAIVTYEKYKKLLLESKAVDSSLVEEADRQIELCRMGKELKELKEQVASLVSRKYKRIENGETSSMHLIDGDGKVAANERNINALVKWDDDTQFFEDMDVAEKKAALYNASDTQHVFSEASVATSIDGQVILIYKDEKGGADLYASTLVGNGWTDPEPLCRTQNKKGWENNECISADGSVMYFTSARKGGYGGADICRCDRLPGGEWSKAVNAGPKINTAFDEEAPFIHPNGQTLYFSSNRAGGPNRFDIYEATLGDSGTWNQPKNIGYPSRGNLNEKKNSVGLPENKRNCTVTCRNSRQETLVLLRGKVSDKDNKEIKHAEITVTDNETGKLAGIYNPLAGGEYLLLLPQGRNMNITYEAEGYLFHSENLDTRNDTSLYRLYQPIELLPLLPGSRIALSNVFFEANEAKLKPSSAIELDNVYRLLHRNNLAVEISCNMNEGGISGLSQARAEAIVQYLRDRGLKKERLAVKSRPERESKRKRRRNKEPHYNVELKITETK